ncbi:phage tail protein I, partial [Leisingera sp. MMG026]|uniref:phage tail protein I n=1 Tax=Leisingera sp. MMG026 TaxID=2909982 RepID=UPI001F026E77
MSDLPTLLPPNANSTAHILETVMAERVLGIQAPIHTLWNADTCPAELLPWLAWAFSVEEWENWYSEAYKREIIRVSLEVHRLKGTRNSVEMALSALGFRIDLVEGWEEGGAGHTFRLDAYGDEVVAAGHALNTKLLQTV